MGRRALVRNMETRTKINLEIKKSGYKIWALVASLTSTELECS